MTRIADGNPRVVLPRDDERPRLPAVELDEETIERINELIKINETSEYTLFQAGD